MSAATALADSVRDSRDLLVRFLAGFDEATRTRQAPNLPNHVAWVLGHCALTAHRAAERLDGTALPDGEFVTGDGRAGDAQRFDTESVCRDSVPRDEPDEYPSLARSRQIFESACERLADALAAAPDAKLDETSPWGGAELTFRQLAARIAFHNGMHTGQIIDLRRVLGFEPVLR